MASLLLSSSGRCLNQILPLISITTNSFESKFQNQNVDRKIIVFSESIHATTSYYEMILHNESLAICTSINKNLMEFNHDL
jgi:hypothetical protein